MMKLCDIRALADLAHAHDALLCVDNTFASPFNQRPLELGADFTMHSSTKYVNGHSDVIGGLVAVRDDALADDLFFIRKSSGAVPGPMDCFLTLRGIKTLHVRMMRHNENGQAVAEFLEGHPRVDRVLYPGLESHEQHDLAKSQMKGFTGMVSVDVGTLARTRALTEHLPALMTHGSVPEDRREAMGITPGLVRFSVGIEDIDDIIADLDRVLSA
jgi:cystathionine beta-lyase/cystathionine gamma-synthase